MKILLLPAFLLLIPAAQNAYLQSSRIALHLCGMTFALYWIKHKEKP